MAVILAFCGARPNWAKTVPVGDALAARGHDVRYFDLSQHTAAAMSRDVKEAYGVVPRYAVPVTTSLPRLRRMTTILRNIDGVLPRVRPDLCLVPGDVDASHAAALACSMLDKPFVHIESGLRSGDLDMPEEANRISIDALANYHLCTEQAAIDNLRNELHLPGALIGNTMIPSLEKLVAEQVAMGINRKSFPLILVTLHRPALVDNQKLLRWWRDYLTLLSKRVAVPIIWPKHPRVWTPTSERLFRVVAPMPPALFVEHLMRAVLVVTDSGGVQEEAAHLGVPCVTLRSTTERPVTLQYGNHLLDPHDTESLAHIDGVFEAALQARLQARQVPLWDTEAGERAANVVEKILEMGI